MREANESGKVLARARYARSLEANIAARRRMQPPGATNSMRSPYLPSNARARLPSTARMRGCASRTSILRLLACGLPGGAS